MRWKVPQLGEIRYIDKFLWRPWDVIEFDGFKYWGCWVTQKQQYQAGEWRRTETVCIGKAADSYNTLDREARESKKQQEMFYDSWSWEERGPQQVFTNRDPLSHEELKRAKHQIQQQVQKIKSKTKR